MGYQHTLEASRFVVGTGTIRRSEFGMDKAVGSEGVFATRISGLVTALANADAASRSVSLVSGTTAAHNEKVKLYFIAAGIPEEQIGGVQDFEVVGRAVDPSGKNGDGPGKLAYRYARLARQIEGVEVLDSFAWAMLNANGDAVEEQIFWPPIPISIVNQAQVSSKALADPARLTQLKDALPAQHYPRYADSKIVIRHSPGEWDREFVVGAFFEVVRNTIGMPAPRHFNLDGRPVALPYEEPDAWGSNANMVTAKSYK